MSIAGRYKVQVKNPKEVREGKNSEGSFEITDEKILGNTIEFGTKLKTPMGHHKATITGTVEGNTFSGVAKLFIGVCADRWN